MKTLSPGSTSSAGAWSRTASQRALLQSLFTLADSPGQPKISRDDLRRWPDGFLSAVQKAGILREEAPAAHLHCDQCPEEHSAEVYYLTRQGKKKAYLDCPDCGRVNIPFDRLRQFSVDWDALASWIGKTLNGQASTEPSIPDRLWGEGTHLFGTRRVPVCLVRGLQWKDAGPTFASTAQRPNRLFLSSASFPTSPSWLKETTVCSLADLIRFEKGRLHFDQESLANAIGSQLGFKQSATKPLTTYPLPPGCDFEQVKVEFASDDSIRFRLPEKNPKVFTYSDLGLQDKRRGDMPNVLWEVLRAFAENKGAIDWKSDVPTAWRKQLPKHIQRLRQHLQSILQTNQDPFEYDLASRGYRCRFQIKDASRGGVGRRSTQAAS